MKKLTPWLVLLVVLWLPACGEERAITSEGICSATPAVGDSCGGGTVYSTNYLGAGGVLIVQNSDQGPAFWRIDTSADTSVMNLDDGRNNTGTFTVNHPASYACQNSSYNNFNDWYLPAENELLELYNNQAIVPGITAVSYWSSTQGSTTTRAREYDMGSGALSETFKDTALTYRCIRRPKSAPFAN